MIELFNIQLNGIDAENFCKKSNEEKIAYIKKHTNQQNDTIINDFLSRPLTSKDCGCGCGGNKNVSNGNQSSGISKTIEEGAKNSNTSRNSKRRNNKG
jgi:hypothetical protein